MRRFFLTGIICVAAVYNTVAAIHVTASQVTIDDLTVDKYNFFVTVEGSTSGGKYELAFDVWPAQHSAIGSFSSADRTISYVSCFVHEKKADGHTVNNWYYCDADAPISLSIISNGDGTCTLTGSIQVARGETTDTYEIDAFTFDYSEAPLPPDPGQDPFRFEPTEPATIDFTADVIHFREREGYIEVTLNEMANETYNWIELRLLSDELAMPAGTYTIDESGSEGSLTASKGYLGSTAGDDPCYVAIRADMENWGQYTPYYLVSGNLEVSYNAKGDTIDIAGTARSHFGSTIHIHARGYNMLFDPYAQPQEPETVTLAIDTVMITYVSDKSDETTNTHYYTFNFFSQSGNYPNVIADAVLSKPMELVAGTYSLNDERLSGLLLFQDQADFNTFFFGGTPYIFETATLTLSQKNANEWTYSMIITDVIGSEYSFSFSQNPHIIFYPQPDDLDPEAKPFKDEQQQASVVSVTLDSLVWDTKTLDRDGIIDIWLTQHEANINGLKAIMQLGLYTSEAYPPAGIYPVNETETDVTFSASLGRYGNILIPCYLALTDENGWAHAVWYIIGGTVAIDYDQSGHPLLSGECTSYFGSTIRFDYAPLPQGIDHITDESPITSKILRNGQLFIIRGNKTYTPTGAQVK